MLSCYGCKYGDLDTNVEPCNSCLENGTPPHWRFEPIGKAGATPKETNTQIIGTSIQLTIFDVIQEDNNDKTSL